MQDNNHQTQTIHIYRKKYDAERKQRKEKSEKCNCTEYKYLHFLYSSFPPTTNNVF